MVLVSLVDMRCERNADITGRRRPGVEEILRKRVRARDRIHPFSPESAGIH